MSATAPSPAPRYDADPAASYRARVRAAEGAANPLLEAARPLLDALANTPGELDAAGVARYRLWLVQHLRMFGKVCGELRLPAEHIEKARYCLCSALDEAAGLTGWGNGSRPGMDWRATGLATTFGYDRQGGDRVYAIATDAMHNRRDNRYLIEVIQHILERGFRGRYRFASDSEHQIAAVRKQIDQAAATLAENAQHTTLTLRLEGIFEAGQSTVNPWVKPMIAAIGQELAKAPERILVTGHTDNQPFVQTQRSSNLALSDARAQEVAQILVSAGVPADRIDSTGKGNAEPAADNTTPQGRMRNRRVEITVSP